MKGIRILVTLTLAFALNTAMAASQFSPEQVKEIQDTVRSYIIDNPDILAESMALKEQKAADVKKQLAKKTVIDNKGALINDKSNPMVGNPKADVVVVEFFDYKCGHCKKMVPIISDLITKESNIRVVYKEFPIFGDASKSAALGALAANNQGKYKEMHTALMSATGAFDKDKVVKIGKDLGLDTGKLSKDMSNPSFEQQLAKNSELAAALGFRGTPGFAVIAVNGDKFELIPGATTLDNLQKLIKNVR